MFDVILNKSRSFGGDESVTSSADLKTLYAIAQHYSHVTSTYAERGRCDVNIDWSAKIKYAEKYHKLFQQPDELLIEALLEFPFERVHVCPASVTIEQGSNGPHFPAEEQALHRLLIEIYLIANLSCPGSFNLYRSFLRNTNLDPTKDPLAQTDLELSEYVYETAWHEAQKHDWLRVGFLPFSDVLDWYEKQEIRGKNAATNDLERAIFCLLHLGRASFLEPTAVLWIASALEALFDTPSGSSFSFLCKRISGLLYLSSTETAELKRNLRAFFDVRNAFAHGGSAVLHPIADDRDKQVEAQYSTLLDVTNFASAVLIGSIQELIRRGWQGLIFEERLLPR